MSEQLSASIQYFLRHLEKQAQQLEKLEEAKKPQKPVNLDEIEHFFRTLKTQNIFIFIVGVNGKLESSSLPKIIYSLSRVVRIYYSLSLDTNNAGYLRIRADKESNLIVVERLHGYHPRPERLYASRNECHVIRFMTRWFLRRIDWEKTKLKNLELYKRYQKLREEQERKKQEEADEETLTPLRLKDVLKKTKKPSSQKKQPERRKKPA